MRILILNLVFFFSLVALPAQAVPKAELWAYWDQADDMSSKAFDHSLWQEILTDYVVAGQDKINRVAYAELGSGDGLATLVAYIDQQAALDPRGYSKAEQLGYWINLYNALTVQRVVKYPKKGSILRMGDKFFSIGPWNDKVVTVAGEALTLNDIEHRILRPIWRDHRIHYAVNCASIGCPNLRSSAFDAANAQALLADAEHAYINHPRGVMQRANGKIQLSSIFDWYSVDFGSDERAILQYLSLHHETLGEVLKNYTGSVKYDYDWGLNSQTKR